MIGGIVELFRGRPVSVAVIAKRVAFAALLAGTFWDAQAFAAPPRNTAVADGNLGHQKTCTRKVGSCDAREHGHSTDTVRGTTSTWASEGFSSWDQRNWSVNEAMSAAPDTEDWNASGSAQTSDFHLKLGVPGAKAKTRTPLHFVLTMTGTDPTLTADLGRTNLSLQVADNKQSGNVGNFNQDNGTYHEDGFSNVSITNVSNASVTFTGDLYIKGKHADLNFQFSLEQEATLSGISGGTTNVNMSGDALVTLSISANGVQLRPVK
jgi:hypothetical protein